MGLNLKTNENRQHNFVGLCTIYSVAFPQSILVLLINFPLLFPSILARHHWDVFNKVVLLMTLRFFQFQFFLFFSSPKQNHHNLFKSIHIRFILFETHLIINLTLNLKANIFYPHWHCYLVSPVSCRVSFLSYLIFFKTMSFPKGKQYPVFPCCLPRIDDSLIFVIVCLSKLLPTPYSSQVPLWFHSLIPRAHLG